MHTPPALLIPTNSITSAHILVVDDQPEIAESLTEFLIRRGYRVSQVFSGREAIPYLEKSAESPENAIDLVLLDMRMPDMPGFEVLKGLRNHADPDLRFTRVIMLTAAAGNKEKIQALNAGADDYVTKPYHLQELIARVNTLLRTQKLEKQLQLQRQQLADLHEIGQKMAATLEIRAVYRDATTAVTDLLDAEAGAIFIQTRAQQSLLCQHITGKGLSAENYPHIPLDKGLISHVAATQTRVRLNEQELVDSEIFKPEHDIPSGLVLRNILAVPIWVRGRAWGVLVAFNKKSSELNRFDEDLLASLSTSLSSAIENAWLVQNLQARQQELLDGRNARQAIIDGILHPIYTISPDWQVVSLNQQKQKGFNTTANKEIIGQTCYKIFYNRDTPCEHCLAKKTLTEGEPQTWAVRWFGEDHLPREWDVNVYPVPGRRATSAGAVVVWQDRTEERRLEQSLLQAGKLAAIGQLAAGVAHEINNPLTAINANAEMLALVTPKDHEDYEAVDLIMRAGQRATKVVRGLLDFAREQQYAFIPIDLNESIQQALDLVAYQLHTSNVTVIEDFAPHLPTVGASAEHIKSVWINLMVNARDAMREAGIAQPELTIITRLIPETPTAEEQIEIIIRDNGPGITSAEAAHIFEPFYTTKDPGKGTGLGLATCLRIIEQHGGRIEMVSDIGAGATFIVRLPTSE